MADIVAHQVELYDPDHPDEPVVVLTANFDPHTMTRWDQRHVTEPHPERGMVPVVEALPVTGQDGEQETGDQDGEEAAFRFERESGAHGTDGAEPDARFATTGAASDATKE